ncbi:sensor histidine kinase [Bordetella petrii]|uniref:histidine kinase n=1 Tax=Bordetella petrii TaxID=94624 RepID=A0ABT7W2L6_9BORD|nr:ATP-binding protein [Bordetella petrii]MDM9559445.1 ATP-binding protein [Bordetella petrii]
MSIKTRIWVFQSIVAFSVIVMTVTTVIATRATKGYFDRVTNARRELAMTSHLAIDANRYSEQIAELMLLGPSELPDFESARADVHQSFARLQQMDLRPATSTDQDERFAPSRYERMRLLMDGINRSVEQLLALYSAGRRDDAIALFRVEIENRLDAEFEQLVAENVKAKRREVAKLEAAAARLRRTVTASMLALLATLLALTSLSGYLLARSLGRPIRALAAGTRAIEQGALEYRIGSRAQDELGALSRSFDAMAARLHEQHTMLLAAKSQLEHEVAQRTRDLAQANQRLTEVDQQRVRFLADISHELRTPLTALRGEAEIALRGKTPQESNYRQALSEVVARAAEMGHLIEDLLFIARSESDDIDFDKGLLDLKDVARAAVHDTDVLARRQNIRLIMRNEAPARAVPIYGDKVRLKQAAMIALDNAIKYSAPGTAVEISVRRLGGEGELAIRDQGAGCAADELPHIFTRFYRGAQARERWAAGSGLGLSIARWIVDKHDGTVRFDSAIGQGSTFTIRLPLRNAHV